MNKSFAIMFIIVIIAIIIIAVVESAVDAKNFNNGICEIDNGNYEFVSASKGKNTKYYYYECDTCGHVIETRSLMN